MQGTLKEISLYELLQLIELNQGTGKLMLKADDEASLPCAWQFCFFQGRLIHGGPAEIQHERIKDYVHRLKLDFSLAGLQKAESEEHALFTGKQHHQQHHPEYALLCALLTHRKINGQQSQALIQRLVSETLFDILALSSGTFQFELIPCPEIILTVPLPTGPTVLRLQQELQAWKQLYPWIKHSGQHPKVVNADVLSQHLTSDTFRHFTRWADGSLSLRRIARHLNRSDLAVAQAIYPYLERNVIRLHWPRISPNLARSEAKA